MTLLKRHRVAKGLEQKDLAKRTGITQGAISHYETGRRVPSVKTYHRLAKALGIPAFELTKIIEPDLTQTPGSYAQ